jgi:uncharacterized protein (DUF934 family)
MPLLDAKGHKEDVWQLVEAPAIGNRAYALLRWQDADKGLPDSTPDQQLGLLIPNTVKLAELEALLPRLSLVAITFPAYGDGRGFSIARQLRDRGFTGTLRAVGPLIADQVAYALACGFDEIDLAEASAARQPVGQWLDAARSFSSTYQRGYGERANILDQRRAGRRQAHV